MKVLLVTTPIRPTPTPFPPFGSLALLQYLRKNGIEGAAFYDIDCLRPSFEEAVDHIVREAPDVLGISAVVSTAYAYTKKLSLAVKKRLPDTLIVVGGNMAASAEILLRRTGADLCVLGEGEKILLNIVRRAGTSKEPHDFQDIKGLMLLDRTSDKLVNTGYELPVPADQLYDIDWDDLTRGSKIDHFFPVLLDDPYRAAIKFNNDPRVFEPHRRHKTVGTLYSAKGCVNRCTFCHRWDKGLRTIPVDIFMQRLEVMISRFNVGFLMMADENFGADRRWLNEFCDKIKKYDILWTAGSRVKGVTREMVDMLKDSGCRAFGFGIESGSPRILSVMEKKTTIDENKAALRATHEAGIPSPLAMVLGMPGESPETIRETIELCKFSKSLLPWVNPNNLALNYAQALPGTPLYEFARHKGLIGHDIDGEEAYLLAISDRDAHDEFTTLNFTSYPMLMVQTWRPLITVETNQHFIKTFGIEQYLKVVLGEWKMEHEPQPDSGYFANPMRLLETAGMVRLTESGQDHFAFLPTPKRPPLWSLLKRGQLGLALIAYPEAAYRLRRLLTLFVLFKDIKKFGFRYTGRLVGEYLVFLLRQVFGRRENDLPGQSLRKIVQNELGVLAADNPAMDPLRKGR